MVARCAPNQGADFYPTEEGSGSVESRFFSKDNFQLNMCLGMGKRTSFVCCCSLSSLLQRWHLLPSKLGTVLSTDVTLFQKLDASNDASITLDRGGLLRVESAFYL